MQEDTYRGDGLNLYAYCANNPVMYYDPSGNSLCPNGKTAPANDISPSGGLVKEGLGQISGKEYTVTEQGVENVREYLTEQGFIQDYENQAMLKRLEGALASGQKITGADAVFYTHELKESQLVQLGMEQRVAHLAALEYYGVSAYSVYHPEVIQMDPSWWNNNWFDFWNIER